MAEITCTSLYGFTSFQAQKQSGRNLAALKSSLQPHGELHVPYAKVEALTAQFADESVEYTMEGISIQYELLECAIKGKSM